MPVSDKTSDTGAAMKHPFDQAIGLEPLAGGCFRGRTSDDYWNFVGPYGGILAAVVLNAVLIRPDRIGDPLSLTVNYAAPVRAGEFEVETKLLRASRTTQHWAVNIVQGEQRELAVSALAVCAIRRSTWSLTETGRPAVPGFDALARATPRLAIKWPRMYDMRFVRGHPAQANTDSLSQCWISDIPPRPLDYAGLASICDAFFPRIFLHQRMQVAIATVSMNIYFHVDAATLARQGTQPVLAEAQGQVFNAGFFDHEGKVWGVDNTLLATTQQIMWFKEQVA